jgi:hypothetical protein
VPVKRPARENHLGAFLLNLSDIQDKIPVNIINNISQNRII